MEIKIITDQTIDMRQLPNPNFKEVWLSGKIQDINFISNNEAIAFCKMLIEKYNIKEGVLEC
jgi:hypothetical protein